VAGLLKSAADPSAVAARSLGQVFGQQGLGLGLYIASEIARAHSGTLGVVSAAGKTTFTFRMPSEG
jgi:signal transduction histidine kinase